MFVNLFCLDMCHYFLLTSINITQSTFLSHLLCSMLDFFFFLIMQTASKIINTRGRTLEVKRFFLMNELISLILLHLPTSIVVIFIQSPFHFQSGFLGSLFHYPHHDSFACHSRLKITPLEDKSISGCTFEPFSKLV